MSGKNLTLDYFTAKAEKYKGFKDLDLTPEMLMFAYNLIYSLKKTRIQAIEYVTMRQALPYDLRRHSVAFLRLVNHFLSSVTDRELERILTNPKRKLLLRDKVRIIVDRLLEDERRSEHKFNYIKGIVALVDEEIRWKRGK